MKFNIAMIFFKPMNIPKLLHQTYTVLQHCTMIPQLCLYNVFVKLK